MNNKKIYYSTEDWDYSTLKQRVAVPKFQRGFVWKIGKQRDFIDTLKNGYPFGSLLLCENENGSSKYMLVDGLQRFETIKKYEAEPFEYIEQATVFDEEIKNIRETLFNKNIWGENTNRTVQSITNSIKNSFIKSNTIDSSINFDIAIKNLNDMEALKGASNLIVSITTNIQRIATKVENYISLENIKIPVVIFRGDKSDLPTVFDRLNSTGVKLSKYQIYAATWSDTVLRIDENKEEVDNSIIHIIEDKYSKAQIDLDVDISEYEEGVLWNTKEVNLFEFAYAMGKIIVKNCPAFFEEKMEESDIDSIGIYTLAGCLDIPFTKLDNLKEVLNKDIHPRNIKILKEKITEQAKKINGTLSPYITNLKNDKDNKQKPVAKFIESQIVSIICTAFKLKYSIDNGCNIRSSDNANLYMQFTSNLPLRYLYDILSKFWAGAADKRADSLLKGPIEENRYIIKLSNEEWINMLDEWMEKQLDDSPQNITDKQKLFLNYLAAFKGIKRADKKTNFTHCIGNLRKKFGNKKGVSVIGNLQIEIGNKNFFDPEDSEIAFIERPDQFTYERYKSFLKGRHNFFTREFIELIK